MKTFQWFIVTLVVVVVVVALFRPSFATAASCDVTGDGKGDVGDVQCTILTNLWALGGYAGAPPGCLKYGLVSPALLGDFDCSGQTDVADVSLAIYCALNSPPSPELDGDGNGIVDNCESDLDLDGAFDVVDCAAQNPGVFPGAPEKCNGYDDNCNGEIDEPWDPDVTCNNADSCTLVGSCKPFPGNLSLMFHEFLADPVAPGPGGEWIELMNGSTSDILLANWSIENGAGQQLAFPPQAFVKAGGYVVLERVANDASPGVIPKSVPYVVFELGDQADTLVLKNPQGVLVDEVDYEPGSFPIFPGVAAALVDPTADNNIGQNWKPAPVSQGKSGSPGGPNAGVAAEFCTGEVSIVCEDCNPCTADVCDPVSGCVFLPITGPCDDGDPLTVNDTCDQGECQAGPVKNCDDGISCTLDIPDLLSITGCSHLPDHTECDDGVGCTLDLCSVDAQGCMNQPQVAPCDDGKSCTLDVCKPGVGCQNTAVNCSVNSEKGGDQHRPKIAPLDPEQGACVVWLGGTHGAAYVPDVNHAVWMQCYDKNFIPLGGNIEVRNVYTKNPGFVNHVDIASSTGNRVAVVWEEYQVSFSGLTDGEHRIMAKIYQCDPVVTKTCTQVYPTLPPPGSNEPTPAAILSDGNLLDPACGGQDPTDHIWPAVAAGPDDDFLVVWGVGRQYASLQVATKLRVRRLSNVGPVGSSVELEGYPKEEGCQGVHSIQLATHPQSKCVVLKWASEQTSSSKTYLATIPKNNIAAAATTPVVQATSPSSNNDHWDITMNNKERLFIAHNLHNYNGKEQLGIKWYAQACDDLNEDSDVGDTGPLTTSAVVASGPTPKIVAFPSTLPIDDWSVALMTYTGGQQAFMSYVDYGTTGSTYKPFQMSHYAASYNQQGDITYTGKWVAAVTHAKGPDGDGLGVFLFVCDPTDPANCWMPVP
ncbi:MAG: lamin tail domain-containing protein [Myxococcales bacterium]|nr:lamin tail domain-containing protein [Myxococcales bacterium]